MRIWGNLLVRIKIETQIKTVVSCFLNHVPNKLLLVLLDLTVIRLTLKKWKESEAEILIFRGKNEWIMNNFLCMSFNKFQIQYTSLKVMCIYECSLQENVGINLSVQTQRINRFTNILLLIITNDYYPTLSSRYRQFIASYRFAI